MSRVQRKREPLRLVGHDIFLAQGTAGGTGREADDGFYAGVGVVAFTVTIAIIIAGMNVAVVVLGRILGLGEVQPVPGVQYDFGERRGFSFRSRTEGR